MDLATWRPADKLLVALLPRRRASLTASGRLGRPGRHDDPRPLAAPPPAAVADRTHSAVVGPGSLSQLLGKAGALHQQQAASKAAEDQLLEARAQEFRDKASAAASKAAKRGSKKGLPETAEVAASAGDEPKAKEIAATKRAAKRANTAPAPKRPVKRSKGKSKGRKSSLITKEGSDSDASPSVEHKDTPAGTAAAGAANSAAAAGPSEEPLGGNFTPETLQPPLGGNTTPEADPTAAGLANAAVAAIPSPTAPAIPSITVLSGGSGENASGSQGTSRTSFCDNINRFRVADWFLGAGFPFDPRLYFY
jgi:hypothetical protein